MNNSLSLQGFPNYYTDISPVKSNQLHVHHLPQQGGGMVVGASRALMSMGGLSAASAGVDPYGGSNSNHASFLDGGNSNYQVPFGSPPRKRVNNGGIPRGLVPPTRMNGMQGMISPTKSPLKKKQGKHQNEKENESGLWDKSSANFGKGATIQVRPNSLPHHHSNIVSADKISLIEAVDSAAAMQINNATVNGATTANGVTTTVSSVANANVQSSNITAPLLPYRTPPASVRKRKRMLEERVAINHLGQMGMTSPEASRQLRMWTQALSPMQRGFQSSPFRSLYSKSGTNTANVSPVKPLISSLQQPIHTAGVLLDHAGDGNRSPAILPHRSIGMTLKK